MISVAVIGGGASGMAFAVALKQKRPDIEVTVFEKNPKVLKKILVTGNGRCNILNFDAVAENYFEACEFVRPAVEKYAPKKTEAIFRDMGLLLMSEQEGRAYPISQTAASVVCVLSSAAERAGVKVFTDTPVKSIKKSQGRFVINNDKSFDFGLDLSFAYTHSKSRSYSDGIGDQVTSAYKTNTYSVNGINEHELGYGTYVAPDRILATIGYKKEYGKHFATSVSLLYEGMQMGYSGSWGYSRYSYTFSSNVVGDAGANSLLYIPATREELDSWKFSDAASYPAKEQRDDFWNYINQDKYLKNRKGKYAERGGAVMPWHHQVDFKLNQDFYLNVGGKRNLLQVGVDIKNLPNLLNNSWGLYKQVINSSLLQYKNGEFTMNKNAGETLTSTYRDFQSFKSTYSVQFSVRYIFN